MVRIILKCIGSLLLLAILLITAFTINYQIETRNHISRFIASFNEREVVPHFVKNKDETPYTGIIYDTYFGDRLWDLKEWEGNFIEGKPSGEFKYFNPDGSVKSVWHFENGIFIKGT